jgi:hypothetical protein
MQDPESTHLSHHHKTAPESDVNEYANELAKQAEPFCFHSSTDQFLLCESAPVLLDEADTTFDEH